MHIVEIEGRMEYELAEAVQRHYPLDWKEDSITHDLMIRYRIAFREVTLQGLRYPLQLEWEVYKLHGRESTKFHQVRREQVHRTLARSRHTRLLLYDYNAVPVLGGDAGFDPDWDWHPHPSRRRQMGQVPVTHGPTVPLEVAAAVNQFDDGLYRFAL